MVFDPMWTDWSWIAWTQLHKLEAELQSPVDKAQKIADERKQQAIDMFYSVTLGDDES